MAPKSEFFFENEFRTSSSCFAACEASCELAAIQGAYETYEGWGFSGDRSMRGRNIQCCILFCLLGSLEAHDF